VLREYALTVVRPRCDRGCRMGTSMASKSTRSTPVVKLTQQFVDSAVCPTGQPEQVWRDSELPGLSLRVTFSGNRSYTTRYRTGGRGARQRRLTLDASKVKLGAARNIIRQKQGEIAAGRDPVGEEQAKARRDRARLSPALADYEAFLEQRRVVKRRDVVSLLRRELERPLGNVDMADIDRTVLVDRVTAVERSGRPGTARALKVRASVFLEWAATEGRIKYNPAAGWRRPRATRAEQLKEVGRALQDWELPAFWAAAGAALWPFGTYLKVLLLCGQRRSETAQMRWSDIRQDIWTIPAAISKSGRGHDVPLPPAVLDLIRSSNRTTSPLVFPGHSGPMSGWGSRLDRVRKTAGLQHWTLHDLRRTFRSGLPGLKVEYEVRELMLNHKIGPDLDQRYDRDLRWSKRVEAAQLWADHVFGIVG